MAASGVTGAILGVFSRGNPPHDMANAGDRLMSAGIPILGWYGLPYFGDSYGATRDIIWATQLAKAFKTRRVWVDAEIDAYQVGFTSAHVPSVTERVATLHDNVAIIENGGISAGMYSAPWWWVPETGNYTGLSHLPLWFANYPASGQPFTYLPQPFGGWTKPTVHQYTSTLWVCGRNRDANYVFEEDEMNAEDRKVFDALVSLMGGSDKIIAAAAQGMDYLLGYAIEQADQDQLEAVVKTLQLTGVPDHVHALPKTTGAAAKP